MQNVLTQVPEVEDRELSVTAAAQLLGVHPLTIYRHVTERGLRARRVSGRGPHGQYMISEQVLRDYLSRNTIGRGTKPSAGAQAVASIN